jgi:hypothetical protein
MCTDFSAEPVHREPGDSKAHDNLRALWGGPHTQPCPTEGTVPPLTEKSCLISPQTGKLCETRALGRAGESP